MTPAPRVAIADEQPTMRASARRLLERDGFAVCGEATDADGAVEVAFRARPDLCLIGVPIPGDVTWATSRIATALPRTPVVLLSASARPADLVEVIRAGAAGYLLKDMNAERLATALRGVLAGEAAIPRALVACLVREFQTQGRRCTIAREQGGADLTARETEVMELMCDGLTTGAIAEGLHVSPVTVRRHISEIVGKLGVEDREAAVSLVAGQT